MNPSVSRDGPFQLTLRGVRGSTPSPGADTVRYGGNTTCLDVCFTPHHRLVLDCGTGIRAIHSELPQEIGDDGLRFDVLLTHYHSDHLDGLRFFKPLYDPRSHFTFHGFAPHGMSLRQAVEGSMAKPWFPIQLADTASEKHFVELHEGTFEVGSLEITAALLHHPQGAAGYRLEHGDHAIAFITDSEPGDAVAASAVDRLARDVDLLIHDAQYTPEEYEQHYRGWGHSSWRHAIEVARRAGARRIVLFHHDPDRSDAELDEILARARTEFAAVELAREGASFPL